MNSVVRPQIRHPRPGPNSARLRPRAFARHAYHKHPAT
jgi:hypothetical protein